MLDKGAVRKKLLEEVLELADHREGEALSPKPPPQGEVPGVPGELPAEPLEGAELPAEPEAGKVSLDDLSDEDKRRLIEEYAAQLKG